ncbi:MAG: O-methyltransferase [Paludibacteraceae bacterium]
MLKDTRTLRVVDYGTGKTNETEDIRRICDIANSSLEKPMVAQFFFRWLVFLSQQSQKPLTIFELGSSLGITAAYMAKPHSRNRVITFEGSEEIAKQAMQVWQRLGIPNIELAVGNIDGTLSRALSGKEVDFAFVDANHTYEATMRYVKQLMKHTHSKSIIAIDDIHYSEEMERAWHELQQSPQVTTTMDFLYVGVLFFDPRYLKKHYRIKLKGNINT